MIKILDRTFGLEIEMADVDKSKVMLPKGYVWSEDEIIHNTNGTLGRFHDVFGGEINTPPLRLSHNALHELKELYTSLIENGAKITRELSIQVHVYIGDLELGEIKNIFYLLYYTARLIDEVCYVSPYSKFTIFTPSPTVNDYEKVKESNSFESLRSVFENSTNKGFVRHIVNISSYFKRKTVEFRPFLGTTDINEVVSCIFFAYRFVYYALTHEESDFSSILDSKDFRHKLKLHGSYPKTMPPLLFFGNPLDIRESLSARSIHYNSAMTKIFIDNTPEDVLMVNPALFSFELSVCKYKKIVLYNNDELNHIIYLVAKGELKIKYNGKSSFLELYNGESEREQLMCLLIFCKINKYFRNNEFCENSLKAIIDGIESTIAKSQSLSDGIINMFNTTKYRLGTINDALNDGGCVFFQYDDFSKHRNIVTKLRKHSDYSLKFKRKETQYYGITENIPDKSVLTVVSRNAYLSLNKIAVVGDVFFYSSSSPQCNLFSPKNAPVMEIPVFIEPPDDLVINNPKLLIIQKVQSIAYKSAQLKYILKVHKIPKSVKFCFLVTYNGFLVGGFGFEWTKDRSYDVWLLSDFCTNNKIPRLSKLILLCLKSNIVKQKLSRLMTEDVSSCYTKIYTSNPASMKYRGLFNKVGREGNHLIYETTLGSINGYDEIIEKYVKYTNSTR